MYCIYCITREDGLKYIGKAKNIKNRISGHKKSKRFEGYNIDYEVLFYSEDHQLIIDAEETYIKIFDTYFNGLNLTLDGSGNNYTEKFTTFGLKWSKKTRDKISQNHVSKKPGYIPFMLGKQHKKETKEHWSNIRKGVVQHTKFTEEIIKEIILLYNSKPKIEFANKIQKNGKYLSYDGAFCKKYAKNFNMSIPNMKKILKGKTIAWKSILEKTINLKY